MLALECHFKPISFRSISLLHNANRTANLLRYLSGNYPVIQGYRSRFIKMFITSAKYQMVLVLESSGKCFFTVFGQINVSLSSQNNQGCKFASTLLIVGVFHIITANLKQYYLVQPDLAYGAYPSD